MKLPIVVIAGGLATRLYPVTLNIPKSLIAINDSPFVLHQLQLFKRQGVKHVHYCLGHLGDLVVETIRRSTISREIEITYSFDGEKLLGTAGAVKKALDFLPESFFVTYGDSYLDINYQLVESFFNKLNNSDAGLMTVYKNANKYDVSNVVYKNEKILLYSKKIKDPLMDYIDFGLSVLRKKHFKPFSDDINFDLSEILENLSVTGNLSGFEVFERFFEIGSLEGIDDLSKYLNRK
jgi:N-acetyl-alpha-D-muramate 1-phosphate uridylyltransferase